MSLSLFDLDDAPSGFQMQSWSSTQRSWSPMDEGPAAKAWAPRAAAQDAVKKCAEWTGLLFIPAMRVVDLSCGEVVWADTSRYPDAGSSVDVAWAPAVLEQVRGEFRAEAAAELAAVRA